MSESHLSLSWQFDGQSPSFLFQGLQVMTRMRKKIVLGGIVFVAALAFANGDTFAVGQNENKAEKIIKEQVLPAYQVDNKFALEMAIKKLASRMKYEDIDKINQQLEENNVSSLLFKRINKFSR